MVFFDSSITIFPDAHACSVRAATVRILAIVVSIVSEFNLLLFVAEAVVAPAKHRATPRITFLIVSLQTYAGTHFSGSKHDKIKHLMGNKD
jgi:hypothetical protein